MCINCGIEHICIEVERLEIYSREFCVLCRTGCLSLAFSLWLARTALYPVVNVANATQVSPLCLVCILSLLSLYTMYHSLRMRFSPSYHHITTAVALSKTSDHE